MVPAYLCCVLLSAQALAAGESGGARLPGRWEGSRAQPLDKPLWVGQIFQPRQRQPSASLPRPEEFPEQRSWLRALKPNSVREPLRQAHSQGCQWETHVQDPCVGEHSLLEPWLPELSRRETLVCCSSSGLFS